MTNPADHVTDRVSNPDLPPRQRSGRPRKTAMTIAQRIVEEISQRQYPAGTKLPSERDMLAHYEVGRGTLRESLRFLEMNGVLTVKPGPGGGPVVAAPKPQDIAGTLGLFLELQGTSLGAILEVREVVEPSIARMAAERATDEQLSSLSTSLELMAGEIDDLDRFLTENERFHSLIAQAADNPVLTMLIGSLCCITDSSPVGAGYPPDRRYDVLAAHRRIYRAVADHDTGSAEWSMREHIQALRRYTDRHAPTAAEQPLRWNDIAP